MGHDPDNPHEAPTHIVTVIVAILLILFAIYKLIP